jgi:CheY-like chemotaxis protein
MDGLQFSRTAKKSYPGIPIILLNSAWNESYGHDQDLFAGIFIKPLRQKILRDSLFAFFDQSSKEQKNEPGTVKNVFASSFPLKILVAEDNLVNQKIAIKILGKLGYNIRMANNGKEAVEIISNEQFDIILMDVQMPEMDGLEATKNIRTQIQVQPIIIALTANVLQGDHDACIQAGMNDYMSKPIDIEDLKSKLKKWFTVSAG